LTMRTIFLYSGEEVLVDDEDFQRVSAHRWYASRSRRGYLYATSTIDGKWVGIHRFITSAEKGRVVDHVDGNGLNNTRSNLRVCTVGQNRANSRSLRSLPKGVYSRRQRTGGVVYRAQIRSHGKITNIGTYLTPQEAAAAYAEAARKIHKEFARP